jgi:hypothetical protein
MDFITEINLEVDKKSWIDNLKRIGSSTTYQLPSWLEIYKNSFNSVPHYITVKNSNHEVVGQLACIIHNDFVWHNSNTVSKFLSKKLNLGCILNWSYGPIISEKYDENLILYEILAAVDEIISKNNIILVNGSSPFDKFNLNIFENFGYLEKKWSTYVLDLTKLDSDLLSNFNKKIRYDVRQAEKNNLQFEVVSDKKQFVEFAKFAVTTKNLSGESRKWNPIFYDNYWNLTSKSGSHQGFLVRHENEILGTINTLNFNGNVVQAGVANSSKSKFNAGTFLTFKTIEWLFQHKQNIFDFGGANPNPTNEKEKQIDFYKSKWGGTKKEYSIYSKVIDRTKLNLTSFMKSPTRITKKIFKKSISIK